MEVKFNQCSETNLPLLPPLRLFNSFAILILITEHGLNFVGSFNIFTFFLFIQLTLEQMLAFDNDVKYPKSSDEGNKLKMTPALEVNIRNAYSKDFEVLYKNV